MNVSEGVLWTLFTHAVTKLTRYEAGVHIFGREQEYYCLP